MPVVMLSRWCTYLLASAKSVSRRERVLCAEQKPSKTSRGTTLSKTKASSKARVRRECSDEEDEEGAAEVVRKVRALIAVSDLPSRQHKTGANQPKVHVTHSTVVTRSMGLLDFDANRYCVRCYNQI